jgi:hypothetical protein
MENLLGEKLKLVYLEWIDTIGDSDNGWKCQEDTDSFFERDDNIVRETGFLWGEDADFVYLVGKYMPSPENILSAHRTKIPKKWILTFQVLDYVPFADPISYIGMDLEEKAICAIKKALTDK